MFLLTAELAEIRFRSGMNRWGIVPALTGWVISGGRKTNMKKILMVLMAVILVTVSALSFAEGTAKEHNVVMMCCVSAFADTLTTNGGQEIDKYTAAHS